MILIDTNKIRDYGKDILYLTDNYSSFIEKIFNRIEGMNESGGAWYGNSASTFIKVSLIDRLQYRKMADVLNANAKCLIKIADKFDEVIRSIRQ